MNKKEVSIKQVQNKAKIIQTNKTNNNKQTNKEMKKIWNYILLLFKQEKIEDTQGVIRNSTSKKERQYNGQKEKEQKDKQR